MFNGEYNPTQIRENQAKIRELRRRCSECAYMFAHETFKDVAPRINSREKLIQFLDWQFDVLDYGGTTKIEWIKEVMSSFRIKFKMGVI